MINDFVMVGFGSKIYSLMYIVMCLCILCTRMMCDTVLILNNGILIDEYSSFKPSVFLGENEL
jgi:hypothetical protein